MNFLSGLCSAIVTKPVSDIFTNFVRGKARKAVGSCRLQQQGKRRKPKFRGMKINHGEYTYHGSKLYTQYHLRFHPGLNVGFTSEGTLRALVPGKVVITCEKLDPNWGHKWVDRHYLQHGEDVPIYKKYYNVIPEEQKNLFVLVDKI